MIQRRKTMTKDHVKIKFLIPTTLSQVKKLRSFLKVIPKLKESIHKDSICKTKPISNWPTREIKPISEYSDTKIFCLAFPWLFPGGIRDIKESRVRNVDIGEWAQNLLFY